MVNFIFFHIILLIINQSISRYCIVLLASPNEFKFSNINLNNIQVNLKIKTKVEEIQMKSEIFSVEAFIFVIILLIYLLTSHIIETKRISYLHESTIAIFMGIMTALFAKYGLGQEIIFSNDLFFLIILPPIIFSAGYNIRKSKFFQNFTIITFLGVVGTLIGFVCMSLFLILINNYIFKALTLEQILLVSCVLCATDPVIAMSLIKSQKYPVLNSVLSGEGIITDSIAIILFRTVSELKLEESNQFTFFTVLRIVFNFTYMFVFSVALGTITGFGLSYLFKKLKFERFLNSSNKQISLILLNGYFTYLMGELLGISGIISLFTCAIIMGNYCFLNISSQAQNSTGLAFDTVSYVAQAFVFAYLGASILSTEGKFLAVIMGLIILLTIPVIRAIMVYPLPILYKIFNKKFPLDTKELNVFWFSGMVRGAITFALCLQIQSKDKKYIITIALVIVMITTIAGSTLIQKYMNYIGLTPIKNKQINDYKNKNKNYQNKIRKLSEQSSNNFHEMNLKYEDQIDSGRRTITIGLDNFQQKFKKPFSLRAHQEMSNIGSKISAYNQQNNQIDSGKIRR